MSTASLLSPRHLVLGLALLLLASASGPADAQWVWRDKDGRVTASDRAPPKDTPDKDIISRPTASQRRAAPAAPAASGASAAASGAEAGKTALDREVEARKRAAEQDQTAKTKAEDTRLAAQRAENCQRARGQQAALESGQRIARLNDKGEREVLDDKGRAEELRQARDVIASDCR